MNIGKDVVLQRADLTENDGDLFQEKLKVVPFWMLVACSLVNQTSWSKSQGVFWQIYEMCKGNPRILASLSPIDLHGILKPIGLWRQRAKMLPALARAWNGRKRLDSISVLELPGCGKYASDSWAIFIEGRTDVEPLDEKLKQYLARLQNNG